MSLSLLRHADLHFVISRPALGVDVLLVLRTTGADPIINPPLYGRRHALTSRLLNDRTSEPPPAPELHNVDTPG